MGSIRDKKAEHQAAKARAEILRDWLRVQGVGCLWQQRVPRVGMLECWTNGARVFLLQHYERSGGFELYLPASDSNRTDETLAAAAKYLRGEK